MGRRLRSIQFEEVTELEIILEQMEIPRSRMHISLATAKWLKKNLGSRNESSPNFGRAIELVNTIIEKKLYPY